MAALLSSSARYIFSRRIKAGLCQIRSSVVKRNFQNGEVPQTQEAVEADEARETSYHNNCEFKLSYGKYAGLADGCAVAEFGGSAVIATVVGKGEPEDLDVPLQVDYHQKSAAIGRIPTNFLRRELGPTDYETLVSRVIDRSLRPLFQPGHAIETQVICSPMALDGANFPETLAINAASAALACSDIPWNGPVAATRVALIDNEVIINPSKLALSKSSINVIITSTSNSFIVMIEGSCNNVLLPDLNRCFKAALKFNKQILKTILELKSKHGKVKRLIKPFDVPSELREDFKTQTNSQLTEILTNYKLDKLARDRALKDVYASCVTNLKPKYESITSDAVFSAAFYLNFKDLYKEIIVKTGKRCDGRVLDEIRNIDCECGVFNALHGSSVFKRGQTQVFCTVSLDSPNSALRMDRVSMLTSGIKEKNFFVHYEFPPFATGEIGASRRKKRREIGHGNLAENALKSAIPKSFPFTVRLTSEVMESNGSSSMATVCGGTLALMDAGVPLEYEISGIAMGLLSNIKDGIVTDAKILTDIMGMEDYIGDIDFKIAGTKSGITALQLDMKVPGLPFTLVQQILSQGKRHLSKILLVMQKASKERQNVVKDNWPVIREVTVPPHLRSRFIGIGKSNIKKLELEVGVEVNEVEDGKFSIFAANYEAMAEALEKVNNFLNSAKEPDLEFGGVYTATVVEVKQNGCCVKLFPSMTPTFIPVSQLDSRRVSHPSSLGMEVGSEFQVKYFGRDPVSGHMRLSRKVLLGRCEES